MQKIQTENQQTKLYYEKTVKTSCAWTDYYHNTTYKTIVSEKRKNMSQL